MAIKHSVQSVDRVFDILEVLATSQKGMTLTQISNELELSSSTTHRLLKVLENRNYVTRLENSKTYVIGLGFLSLISSRLSCLELKTEATPILTALSHQINQVVFLGVKDGLDVMYLDKKCSENPNETYCSIGFKLPLHCTGLGKALLMEYSSDEIRKLYNEKELISLTPHTINNVEALIKATEENKQRGFAIDDEENSENIVCVSSPVYDYTNKIVAAVSTSWKKEEINLMPIYALSVKQAADKISERMGYVRKN